MIFDEKPKIKVVGTDGKMALRRAIALREFKPENIVVGFSQNFFRKKKVQYIETDDVCVYYEPPYKLPKELEKALKVLNKIRK